MRLRIGTLLGIALLTGTVVAGCEQGPAQKAGSKSTEPSTG